MHCLTIRVSAWTTFTHLHHREGDGWSLSAESQQSHEAALGEHIVLAELRAF